MSQLDSDTCSICVGAVGATSIVEIAGEVDIATVSLLSKALGDAVTSAVGDLILDTQRLTYIDSTGIQALVSTQQKLESQGRVLAVVGCHGIFGKLMEVSHLSDRFPTYSSVDEALIDLEEMDAPAA